MFLQVFQGPISDASDARAALDDWVARLAPGASGWLGSTVGITDDGVLVATARFSSAETAQRNSDRPEQAQWWTETSKLFRADVTFTDYHHVDLLGAGGSDEARFVQVIRGRSTNVERSLEMARAFGPMMSVYRPDLLGITIAWQPDGDFTQLGYFMDEEQARRGESQELPPEARADFDEEMRLTADVVYYDLRDPWLFSPAS